MDTAKKVLDNKEIICFNENGSILVDNVAVDNSVTINFNSLGHSHYTLDSVLLFIFCSNLSHPDYVEECARFEILPVKITDKEKIIEEVKNYIPPRKRGMFVYPIYSYNSKIEIPEINFHF